MNRVGVIRWLPIALLVQTSVNAASVDQWVNQGQPAQLVELFTSEGCSSCPPADKYLSRFKQSDGLWDDIIPLAFHVDYWNYLGWKDEFSHPSFTQRQRLYRTYGASGSVYTPGFFVDGKEWRGYFSRSRLPENKLESAGTLKVQRSDNKVAVNYSHDGAYIAHIALLAMDETTEIKAGENRGRTLDHDFVVLEKQQMRANSDWQFQLKNWSDRADAIAVWLTKPDSFTPIQTVAGFLSKP